MFLPVEPGVFEGDVAELAHRVRLTRGDHGVVGLVVLEDVPHRLQVVAGEASVTLGVEVAEVHLVLLAGRIAAAALVIVRVTKFSP